MLGACRLQPGRLTKHFPLLHLIVSPLRIEFREGSVHLPELGLWLDAHEPQAERVFVSHAHSDHIAEHRQIIVSAPTAKLMQARLAEIQHFLEIGRAHV